jgi:hypothetical protein
VGHGALKDERRVTVMVLVDGRRFLESYLKGCFLLKSVVLIESMMVMMMMTMTTTRREMIVNNVGPAMSSGRSMEYLDQNLVRPIHIAYIERYIKVATHEKAYM